MKIVLIRCFWIPVLWPPDIGLAYIAAVLKKDGHEVSVFDLNIEFYHKMEEFKEKLEQGNRVILEELGEVFLQKHQHLIGEICDDILKLQPEIIGFCIWQTNTIVSRNLAKRLKEIDPSIFIIFGGPDSFPLFSGRKIIEDKIADVVVYGEAEITIRKVLDSISKDRKVMPIQGTIINRNGKIVDCGWPDLVENLDELPVPAWDNFPLHLYIDKNMIPISFSRGCAYKCEYCPRETYPGYRCRSAENIVSEIESWLHRHPSRRTFSVSDSALNNNPRQVERLCDLIIDRNLNIQFGGFAVPHPRMDYRFLLKMKKAGFNGLCYGVESGSDRMLAKLGKKIKLETIQRVIKDTYEAGISVTVDILVGLPGETEDDFDRSLDFLIQNRKYITDAGAGRYGVAEYSYIKSHREEFELIPEEVINIRFTMLKKVINSLNLSMTNKY